MRYSAALCFMTVLALSGCAGDMVAGISIDSSQHVVIGNEIPADALSFGTSKVSMVDDHLLAQVDIKNETNQTQYLEYLFDWYDSQGLEVNIGNDEWEPLIVLPSQSITIQELASTTRAKNFRVSLRDAK